MGIDYHKLEKEFRELIESVEKDNTSKYDALSSSLREIISIEMFSYQKCTDKLPIKLDNLHTILSDCIFAHAHPYMRNFFLSHARNVIEDISFKHERE